MKNSDYFKYEREDSSGWFSSGNIITVILMVFILFSIFGILYYRSNVLAASGVTTDGTGKDSSSLAARLKEAETKLTQKDAKLIENEAKIKDNEARIKDNEARIKEMETKLAQSQNGTADLTAVRSRITGELAAKFSSLKLPVDIDSQTGAVRFSNALLFDVNKETINADGQNYLKKFMPAYLSILLSSANMKYIDQIIIEGHADDGGTYQYNLGLSQNRAYAVADYIFSQKLVTGSGFTDISKFFTISGRSFSQPVIVNGTVDRKLSRRVEFKFRLKDELLDNQLDTAKKVTN